MTRLWQGWAFNDVKAPWRRRVCHVRGRARAELHFHLLPDVDDGPADLDEAVALARLAVADGTSLVTVTPHVRDLLARASSASCPRACARWRPRSPPPACRSRCAPAPSSRTTTSRARRRASSSAIAQGPRGARWVLIEAPLFGGDLDGFLAATAEIRARGFGTLIGHPERCAALMEHAGAVAAERRAGARLQVNALLADRAPRRRAQAAGVELLHAGHADLIASDAHRVDAPAACSPRRSRCSPRPGIPRAGAEALVATAPRALLAHGIAPRGVRAA